MTTTEARGRGEAGRKGTDVRSDLFVTVEARDAGGIELEIASKVALYYGEAIRQQALTVLDQLGVKHARVGIEDAGALPYVIAARLEAAVRRAGLGAGRKALPPALPRREATPRDRLRRSRLYLPGSEPKFQVSAGLHGPDGIILDLEDSVHPAEKDAARLVVRNALRAIDFCEAERMVRINQLPLGFDDLDEIVPEAPDLILIPKVETPEQVREVDARIRAKEPVRPVWIMPILESALGLENAFAIATATVRVVALTVGLEDYTADLGVVKTREGAESLWARQRLVNAARAAGIQAIDSVYGDVGDLDGLRAWGARARGMGFDGMGCVHPRQIDVIHGAFAPDSAEIAKAQRIVGAFEEAQAKGLGVISLGSKMIDPPVVKRALELVRLARAMGLLPPAEVQP
jgi:citrate lyase subunit beta/citryl-CoA lyase